MRTIGIVTTARSDYGIYVPLLRALQAAPDLQPWLFVSGMHLAPEFGHTVNAIEQDGFEIRERVEMLLASDSAEGVSKSIGLGVLGFAQAFARSRPDLLVLLGDRFEMLGAGVASLPFNLPLAHLYGGESTEGLIDEAIRHSLTKISHLHFVSTEKYRQRVIQMGEAPERVVVSGLTSLDHLRSMKFLSASELEQRFGLRVRNRPLLVTFHPVTLERGQAKAQVAELLAALAATGREMIFTYPNADMESREIIEQIRAFAATNERAQIAVNLGSLGYFSLMALAGAMVGNSSSGILEAASFKLPVVNIGVRQRGRLAAANVIHVEPLRAAILEGLERCAGLTLHNLVNPYGDGYASERIVNALREVELGPQLLLKRFHEAEVARESIIGSN